MGYCPLTLRVSGGVLVFPLLSVQTVIANCSLNILPIFDCQIVSSCHHSQLSESFMRFGWSLSGPIPWQCCKLGFLIYSSGSSKNSFCEDLGGHLSHFGSLYNSLWLFLSSVTSTVMPVSWDCAFLEKVCLKGELNCLVYSQTCRS